MEKWGKKKKTWLPRERAWYCIRGLRPMSPKTTTHALPLLPPFFSLFFPFGTEYQNPTKRLSQNPNPKANSATKCGKRKSKSHLPFPVSMENQNPVVGVVTQSRRILECRWRKTNIRVIKTDPLSIGETRIKFRVDIAVNL